MSKGPRDRSSSTRLRSRSKRRATDAGPERSFVHAFADALRDILRDERKRAA